MEKEGLFIIFSYILLGNFQALVHGPFEKAAQTAVKKSKATDKL